MNFLHEYLNVKRQYDPTRAGQQAYQAYCQATKGRSLFSGEELPDWQEMDQLFRDAWIVVATQLLGTDPVVYPETVSGHRIS